MTEDRHVPMVDGIVTWAGRTLDANEDLIRDMVHQRAGWILRLAGLDEKLADAIVDGLRKLTIDMAVDPASPAARQGRGGARPARRQPAERSRDHGQGRGVEERDDRQRGGQRLARRRLGEQPRRPAQGRARSRRRARRQVRRGAAPARRDAAEGAAPQARAINQFARRAAVGIVASYGDGIVKLVSETVRAWDAGTVTDRLEGAVGRDLQYIRINGTLVGGLVGLVIHTIEVADMSEADDALREMAANRGCRLVKSRAPQAGRRLSAASASRTRRPARRCSASARRASPPPPRRSRPSCAATRRRAGRARSAARSRRSAAGRRRSRPKKPAPEPRADEARHPRGAAEAMPRRSPRLIGALGYEVTAADVEAPPRRAEESAASRPWWPSAAASSAA